MLICLLMSGCGSSAVGEASADGSQAVSEKEFYDSIESNEAGKADGSGLSDDAKLRFVNQVRPQVEGFCADCHVMPRPSSSTRDEWVEEIDQGFMLYEKSGRSDLAVPSREDVLKFFQYQAPEQLLPTENIYGYPRSQLPVEPEGVRYADSRPPGITSIRWVDLGMEETNALLYSDIGNGGVIAHWPLVKGKPTKRLATLLQPVHLETCDLNQDGLVDVIAGDIGEFDANDTDLGRIVWLRQKEDQTGFTKHTLLDGVSRIADVQPGDFDGDGQVDLLVGVFGWRDSGQILMLRNYGISGEEIGPSFEVIQIDPRHGAVNVTPVDLNQDGKLDFVALISQGYETVEAFLNNGDATFRREVLFQAPDPAYGSSGIELVDFDLDGDIDVLLTNGDSFDRGPKPYHSVQWLENTGATPFEHHHLCEMPGAMNATACDFDGDGDLDVLAVALLAPNAAKPFIESNATSTLFLEQTEPQVFKRHQIETSRYESLTVEAADFDQNGSVDFAIGTFRRAGGVTEPDLTIWWNRR
ncbi:MAG: VCBS repeat-containing protein [Planctomycetota bacterium]